MTNQWVRFLMVFSVLGLTCPLSADSGHEKAERSITVQGQGKVSVVPDIATLSVEVSHDGPDLDALTSQVRKEMSKVFEAAKAQGIAEKDIQTQFFQVRPKYEQDKRFNPRRVGFVVSNSLSLKVRDLKKVGKVLSALVSTGATTVNGPNFEVDNPQTAEAQALAAATQDAKVKAQAVAQAAGVTLGDILTINPQNVNWPVPPRPMMMRAMAMRGAAVEAEEPVAAGEQTITGEVTITYLIR